MSLGEYLSWCLVVVLWLVAIALWFPAELETIGRSRIMRPFVAIVEWLSSQLQRLFEWVFRA